MITYRLLSKQLFFIFFAFNINAFEFSRIWSRKEKEEICKEYQFGSNGTININNINGNITIVGFNQDKIEIKLVKVGLPEDIKNTFVTVKTDQDTANINAKLKNPEEHDAAINYIITVPQKSNINIKNTGSSNIKIKHVMGTIDIKTEEGSIEVENSIETVTARIQKGSINIKQKEFSEPHAIFLETQKGDIILNLSKNAQANLQAKTVSGTVTSEQEITLEPQTVKLNKETFNRFKKEVKGTINSGGGFITLEVAKGNIYLKEYL